MQVHRQASMPRATLLSAGADVLSGAIIMLLMMGLFSEGCIYKCDVIGKVLV
jgi:hypothetical protein